jgi:hypothetical protein
MTATMIRGRRLSRAILVKDDLEIHAGRDVNKLTRTTHELELKAQPA